MIRRPPTVLALSADDLARYDERREREKLIADATRRQQEQQFLRREYLKQHAKLQRQTEAMGLGGFKRRVVDGNEDDEWYANNEEDGADEAFWHHEDLHQGDPARGGMEEDDDDHEEQEQAQEPEEEEPDLDLEELEVEERGEQQPAPAQQQLESEDSDYNAPAVRERERLRRQQQHDRFRLQRMQLAVQHTQQQHHSTMELTQRSRPQSLLINPDTAPEPAAEPPGAPRRRRGQREEPSTTPTAAPAAATARAGSSTGRHNQQQQQHPQQQQQAAQPARPTRTREERTGAAAHAHRERH